VIGTNVPWPAEDRNPSTGVQGNMILASDIGGTNARFAIVEAVTGELKIIAEQTFPSCERTSLEAERSFSVSNPITGSSKIEVSQIYIWRPFYFTVILSPHSSHHKM
jgi:hypothetical protein